MLSGNKKGRDECPTSAPTFKTKKFIVYFIEGVSCIKRRRISVIFLQPVTSSTATNSKPGEEGRDGSSPHAGFKQGMYNYSFLRLLPLKLIEYS